MLVLWVCSHFLFEGYVNEYIVSPFISFEFAVLANFIIAYFFIWRERISRYTVRSFFRHFSAYNLSSFGVFLFKLGVIQGVHFIFPKLDVLICNIIALCFSGGINFILNEWVIFRKKEIRQAIEYDLNPEDDDTL